MKGFDRVAALKIAERYLQALGYQILDRDWTDSGTALVSPKAARLDIATEHRKQFVGVVVQGFGASATLSDTRKRLQRKVAARWLEAHGKRYEVIRIDVVRVRQDGAGNVVEFEHLNGVA